MDPPARSELQPEPVAARFVGGMNVPSTLGRLNATVPLAVLTIADGRLRLHPRPFPFPMFTDFEVPLREIAAAFPLRGTLMTSGVGIELSDGLLAYFWTLSNQGPVLAALHQHGVRIDQTPRRAIGALKGQFGWVRIWRRTPSSSVAQLSGLSRVTVALLPFSAVVGLAAAAGLGASGPPTGWVGSLFLVAGSILTVSLWLRQRQSRRD